MRPLFDRLKIAFSSEMEFRDDGTAVSPRGDVFVDSTADKIGLSCSLTEEGFPSLTSFGFAEAVVRFTRIVCPKIKNPEEWCEKACHDIAVSKEIQFTKEEPIDAHSVFGCFHDRANSVIEFYLKSRRPDPK